MMPDAKRAPEPAPPPDPAEAILLEQLEKQREQEAELITREQEQEQDQEKEVPPPVPGNQELRRKKARLLRGLDEEQKPRPPLKLFPAPFTMNFHPDHKDARGRPPAFWDYWKQVYDDPMLRDRVVVYIYRLWPVMVEGKRQVTKAFAPFPYEDLLKLYGCGDYFLKLNDAAASKKMRRTICNCKVTMVGNYNLTEYPPLLDIDGLDVSNPHNERYILWCESRGIKIPGKEEEAKQQQKKSEEDDVSEVTRILLDQYTQLTNRMMRDDNGNRKAAVDPTMAAVAPMVAVIKTATEGANQIMQKAYERTAELQQKQQNPTKAIAETVTAIKELLPQNDANASKLVASYLEAMKEMSNAITKVNSEYVDRMVQMTNQRLHSHEEQMKALLEAIAKRQEAAPAPAAGQPQSFKDMLREMAEFKDQMRDLLGVDDDKPAKSGWSEYLPDILKAVTVLGTTIAAAMHNFAVAKTGQGQPVPVQPAMPSAAPTPPPPPVQATAEQPTQEQQPDMMAQYHNLLSMLRPSLLKSFMDGESGADYAERLIELTDAGLFGPAYSGRQIYDAILEAGEMSVATVIKTFPPIWDVVKQTPQKWERFLHEFFTADEIWAKEDAEAEQQQPVTHPALERKKKT
jgi:hypothetical protein